MKVAGKEGGGGGREHWGLWGDQRTSQPKSSPYFCRKKGRPPRWTWGWFVTWGTLSTARKLKPPPPHLLPFWCRVEEKSEKDSKKLIRIREAKKQRGWLMVWGAFVGTIGAFPGWRSGCWPRRASARTVGQGYPSLGVPRPGLLKSPESRLLHHPSTPSLPSWILRARSINPRRTRNLIWNYLNPREQHLHASDGIYILECETTQRRRDLGGRG